jgi:hypothetical protein
MFGGIKYDNKNYAQFGAKETTNELWSYDLLSNKWFLVNKPNIINQTTHDDVRNYVLPIGVSGHSMHLIRNSQDNSSLLSIFFGYSEYYGQNLNLVQEYNLDTKTWDYRSVHNFNIGYAHSSTFNPKNNQIYFYGGLLFSTSGFSSPSSISSLPIAAAASSFDQIKNIFFDLDTNTNTKKRLMTRRSTTIPFSARQHNSFLYSYNLDTFDFKQLAKSPQMTFMHSADLLNEKILLFYGGLHSETSLPAGSWFYKTNNNDDSTSFISNQLKAYDLNQNKWLLDNEFKLELNKRQRYAHSSFIQDSFLYIYGGFNGFFLKDLFRVDLGLLFIDKSEKKVDLSIMNDTAEPRIFRKLTKQQNTLNYTKSKEDVLNDDDDDEKQHYKEMIDYQNLICTKYTSCNMCQMDQNCIWNMKKCEYFNQFLLMKNNENNNQMKVYQKRATCQNMCYEHASCLNCTSISSIQSGQFYQNECVWSTTHSKCLLKKSIQILFPFNEFLNLIADREHCDAISSNNKNQHPQFIQPKQQFQNSSNNNNNNNNNICSQLYSNCSACTMDERCGWCTHDSDSSINAYETNTGLGECLEGGQSGPIVAQACKSNWYYSNCPQCECNGHSTCIKTLNSLSDEKFYCKSCSNNSYGDNCAECMRGYYGEPRNGGMCLKCECGEQADDCDSLTGRCYCKSKGVIGSTCDICDSPRYTGKPHLTNGSCYYNLTIDYQFTFNLNKEIDRYYSRLSFVNHPIRFIDDDIDFMVKCIKKSAIINVSYALEYDYEQATAFNTLNSFVNSSTTLKSRIGESKNLTTNIRDHFSFYNSPPSYYFGPTKSQNFLLTRINCSDTEYKHTFSNKDLGYADRDSFIFVVHVYDFETPISIQIAFSRKSKVHLVHFFVTFFGCLLTLLTIAFITWKTKQRYDLYRRQREVMQQMEHMASRPFAKLYLDVDAKFANELPTSDQHLNTLSSGEANNNNARRGSKKWKKTTTNHLQSLTTTTTNDPIKDLSAFPRVMPVAVEPLNNNKTAILTCLLRLPQGDRAGGTPKGSSPFVLCSTFVNLNQSLTNYAPNNLRIKDDQDDDEQSGEDQQQNRVKNVQS